MRRRTEQPKWQARLARWQRRAHDNPLTICGLVGASAVIGLPPLGIISVMAGQLRTPLAMFVLAVLTGRTLRFAAVLAGMTAIDIP